MVQKKIGVTESVFKRVKQHKGKYMTYSDVLIELLDKFEENNKHVCK